MSKRIRLIDIARETGTSVSAVSKILGRNNCPGIGVCKEKAELIRQTARKYNYVPNLHARALVGQSSSLLGVLVDSCQPPVMSRLLASIEHHASLAGYRLIITEAHESLEQLHSNYDILREHGVDGFIFMSHSYPGQSQLFRELFAQETHIVYQGVPALETPCVSVDVDLEQGMHDAVRHLQQTGRKRIALVLADQPDVNTISQRIHGYEQAMSGAEQLVFNIQDGDNSLESTKSKLTELVTQVIIPQHIDGLIMQNDSQALMMLGILAQKHLLVPQDIAVIGYDDEPFASFCQPELTTVNQEVGLLAKTMVEEVVKLISRPDALTESRHIRIKPRLMVRKSTCLS